jgi:hypothetical protein
LKVGTENRAKVIAAVVLFAAGILLFVRMLQRPAPATANAPRQQAAGPAQPQKRTVSRGKRAAAILAPSLDPRLKIDLLKSSEDTKYEGTGRNIFRAELPPPPIPKPVASAIIPPAQTGPPPPPPINLKFFGFASKPGESKRVFLSQGEDVFIAAEGEIVNRRYRVVRISPNSVEIEDVLSNNRQSIPLTAG